MQYYKEKTLTQVNVQALTGFLGLAMVATILPFYIHLQWITGPIINAILIIALFIVGIRSALVICLVPSLMALSGGLLPAVLAPAIPFIMISNVIFVITIEFVYSNFKDDNTGYWVGVGAAAFLKFIFLYASVNLIGGLLIKQELIIKVAQMMSWPQFITALLGGLIAYVFLKFLKRF